MMLRDCGTVFCIMVVISCLETAWNRTIASITNHSCAHPLQDRPHVLKWLTQAFLFKRKLSVSDATICNFRWCLNMVQC